MRATYAAAVFIFCICVGVWITDRSWNGMLFVYVGEQRAPASLRSLGEYSPLDHSALHRSVQAQLLAYAQIYKDEGLLGVQLGQPVLTGKNGGREFGCRVQDLSGAYDRMEMVFVGTGVAAAGEMPRMVVDAYCRSEHDLNQLETIWIPMQTMLQSQPKDQEFDFPGENMMHLRFESIPDQWPENWVLWSVRFYSDQEPENSLLVDSDLLRQAKPSLLSFEWKTQ